MQIDRGLMERNRSYAAFTVVELIVVACVIAVLTAWLFSTASNHKVRSQRLRCVNNLRAIKRGFAVDVGNFPTEALNSAPTETQAPMDTSASSVPATNFAGVFRAFQVLSNELVTPSVLICPADTGRIAATNFSGLSDTNISYCLAIDGGGTIPNGLMAGDRRLLIDGAPPPSRVVVIQSTNVLTWTIHPGGNVLLSDGSIQNLSSSRLLTPGVMRLAFP